MLDFTLRKQDETRVVLAFRGYLVLGQESETAREALAAVSGKFDEIVVDMSGVDKLDSTGIGVLVGAHSNEAAHGGRVRLIHLSNRVAETLLLVKLLTVFGAEIEDAVVAS
jgi:anti-sigma B factor antagonist